MRGIEKRLGAVLLALVLMFSQAASVFADSGHFEKLSADTTVITLDNDAMTVTEAVSALPNSYSPAQYDMVIYAKSGSSYKYMFYKNGTWSAGSGSYELSQLVKSTPFVGVYVIGTLTDPSEKRTPEAGDFAFKAPENLTTGAGVSITSFRSGMGEITVYYSADKTNWTVELPTASGIYYAAVDVTEGSSYKAAEKLTDSSWTFTLGLNQSDVSTGAAITSPAAVEEKSIAIDFSEAGSISLPKIVLEAVLSTDCGLQLKMANGIRVSLNKEALSAVLSQAQGEDVKFSAVCSGAALNTDCISSGAHITDLKGGVMTVRLSSGDAVSLSALGSTEIKSETKEGYASCTKDENCVLAKFSDVSPLAWYHDGVHFCVEKGLMNGLEGDIFAPNASLSRAMIVTMLWNLDGKPVVNYAMSFADVAESAWCADAIRWAQAEGIVTGYSNTQFGANDGVTREQLAAVLQRYAAYKGLDVSAAGDLSDFSDAFTIRSFAKESVAWANAEGLLSGREGGLIAPSKGATRAEAASMLQRFCENVME